MSDFNISFPDNEKWMLECFPTLEEFVSAAIVRTGGRWNEVDATGYYNKVVVSKKAPLPQPLIPASPSFQKSNSADANTQRAGNIETPAKGAAATGQTE